MSHDSESNKNVVCLGNGWCNTAIVKQELIKNRPGFESAANDQSCFCNVTPFPSPHQTAAES